jgi:hypothetical protein
MKWTKKIHGNWRDEELKNFVHKWHYTSGSLSIIWPSMLTYGSWELYDGNEIYRFATLMEAQKFWEKFITRWSDEYWMLYEEWINSSHPELSTNNWENLDREDEFEEDLEDNIFLD